MGYSTDFEGDLTIEPPLNQAEVDYLRKFNHVRHMRRGKGPYFVDGSGDFGQGQDSDILNYNDPDPSQPGLWCHWIPADEGHLLTWDYGEKTYDHVEWLEYIINHFLKPGAYASRSNDPQFKDFTFDHVLNGEVEASGEEPGDLWKIEVVNNKPTVRYGQITYI